MKKIISMLLCVLLVCNMGVFVSVAQSPEGIISISTVSALPGSRVEVVFHLKCSGGVKSLALYDFSYDTSVLSAVESECQWMVEGILRDIDFAKNSSAIAFSGNTVLDEDVLRLVFNVSQDAAVGTVVPISCSVLAKRSIENSDETELTVSLVPGSVEISDSTTKISDFEYRIENDGIVITGYTGTRTDVVIGDSYEIDGTTYSVVGIDPDSFNDKDIVSVVIPESVQSIGDGAFFECRSLMSITVLGKDTVIGEEALGYYQYSRKETRVVEGVIIYGYISSTSEAYATENGITFVPLSEEHTHDFSVLQFDDTDHWYKCTDCDATTEKTAHSGGTATCTEKAKCSVCDMEYGDVLGHDWSAWANNGETHIRSCQRDNCNATEIAGHVWNDGVPTKTANCSVEGEVTYTCTAINCGAQKVEKTDKDMTNHIGYGTETRDYVAATCEADGYTGDTYCLGCKNKIGNGTVINKLAHEFTVLQSDATDHWYKCANCTATTEKAAHTGGTATCTEKAKCEVCEAEYGELADHDYSVLQSDATDHWYKCANCDATTEKEAHKGGTATCTAKAKCEVCDAEYGDLADHDYSVLQSDATDHWYRCANCDATTEKVSHSGGTATCTEKAKCEVCEAEYGELADHDYSVLQSDATDHWYKCANCDATTEKVAHSGGTATCTAKAKCEVCDAEYGDLADHDYSVLQSDATDHWYKCAGCDLTTEKVAHSGGTATCTAKAKCEVCDAEYGDLAEHSYTVLQSDATDHWYKCANCDATTEKVAHSGGTATCTAKAKCEVCEVAYGIFNYANHSTTETVTKNEKAAGYTFKGYTGDTYCAACDHLIASGTDIDKLTLADNETVKSANEILAAEEAAPGTYDAEQIAALEAALAELETLANDENENAVLTKIAEIGTMVTGLDPISYVTVTFTVDGEVVSTQTIRVGESATAPEQTEYINDGDSHKHFSGWTGDYTDVTEDVTITATYETKDHVWVEGAVTKAATCMESGTQAQSCVCGATKTKPIEIDPTNHADYGTKVESAKAATCEEAGYTGDTVCIGCGEVITSGTSIDPLGHSFTNYVSDGNASCTEDGTKTAICDRCDAKDTIADEGSATGHIDADGDSICDDCGADVTPKNACEYCGKVHEGFFGKIVQFFHNIFLKLRKFFGGFGDIHLHSYKSVVTEPTCTEQGYTTHICKICGRTYTDNYTDALGHDFGEWITDVEPTCISEGHQYQKCSRCDAKNEKTIPVSSVHVDENNDGVCDLCGKTGVCSFCGRIHNGFLGGLVKGVHNVLHTIIRFFKK